MKKLLFAFTLLSTILISSCGSENLIRMSYSETQCADAWLTGGGSEEAIVQSAVVAYFDAKGVTVSEVEVVDFGDIITCAACDCSSNRQINLMVDETELTLMEAEGFTKN